MIGRQYIPQLMSHRQNPLQNLYVGSLFPLESCHFYSNLSHLLCLNIYCRLVSHGGKSFPQKVILYILYLPK